MSDDLLADSVKCGHLLGVARAELESCNQDFDTLTQMFNNMRTQRDTMKDIGDKLAEFVVSHVPCSCRREWVCHKCQTLKDWEGALHD